MRTNQADILDYVRDMAREMAAMTDAASLPFLTYLLHLVEAEADGAIKPRKAENSERPR